MPMASAEHNPLMANGGAASSGHGATVDMGYESVPSQRSSATKQRKQKIRRVAYTAQNHLQVLLQMHGSALPSVLPFCIANVIWTVLVHLLRENGVIDLTFKSQTGHSFMGLLVSFLVVSRSGVSYNRFMQMRHYLAETYRSCREMIQFATVYSFKTQTPAAIAWRQEVGYRTILLLRITMDTLRWSSEHRENWERSYKPTDYTSSKLRKFSHGRRTMIDENFRAPTMFAQVLRETIMKHPEALGYTLHANEYRDLCHFVTDFNKAFHGFRVLIFTPYPFPLVQMTRMFLFFWVYSLPLVLLLQLESLSDTVLIVFLITFGFVGIEYVSMTLDDPFGCETNDVDEMGMAELVFEDIYLTIFRTDGAHSARRLQERVLERYRMGRGLDCFHRDKESAFWGELGDEGSAASAASDDSSV